MVLFVLPPARLVGKRDDLCGQAGRLGAIDLAVVDHHGALHDAVLDELLGNRGVHRVELGAEDAVVVGLFAEGHLPGAANRNHAYAVVDVCPCAAELHQFLAVALGASVGVVESALRAGELIGGDGQKAAAPTLDGAALQASDMVHIDDGITACGGQHETVFQRGIVGVQPAVHRKGVVFEVIDATDDRSGIGAFAADVVPADEVARVVGAVGTDDLVAVGGGVGEVAGVALQTVAPREGDEAVFGRGTHDVLALEEVSLLILSTEVLPRGGRQVGGGSGCVHEVGHHHTVSLHSHTAAANVRAQEP